MLRSSFFSSILRSGHVKTLQKVLIADEYVFAVLSPYLTKVFRHPGIAHTDGHLWNGI
jgi:hypothetical protein